MKEEMKKNEGIYKVKIIEKLLRKIKLLFLILVELNKKNYFQTFKCNDLNIFTYSIIR